jgi:hypothetical protein
VLTGTVPIEDYLAPRNLVRLIGARGMARVMLGRLGDSLRRGSREEALAA